MTSWKMSTRPARCSASSSPQQSSPPDLVARARRYGWPADAPVVPVMLRAGPTGPIEPDGADLRHLATAALVAAGKPESPPPGG